MRDLIPYSPMSSLLLFVRAARRRAVRSRRSVLLKHQLLILNRSRRRAPGEKLKGEGYKTEFITDAQALRINGNYTEII